MQRLIVTSATYRQSSKSTPELLEKDPENRLLARGPRFRLPAEMVRDNALSREPAPESRAIGGPSVFPYQPPGLWEEHRCGETFTAQEYPRERGADLYRRSMYTFWKRTVPPAALTTFDAPDREKCTSRRAHHQHAAAGAGAAERPDVRGSLARAGAARASAKPAADAAGPRAASVPRSHRAPSNAAEAAHPARPLRSAALEHYQTQPDIAAKLIAVGASKPGNVEAAELAAWTTVASTILNLDETITKE